jgi:hypothetical protein
LKKGELGFEEVLERDKEVRRMIMRRSREEANCMKKL